MQHIEFSWRVAKHIRVQFTLRATGTPGPGLINYFLVMEFERPGMGMRVVQRPLPEQPELQTPLQAIALVIALYPELNPTLAERVPSPDPADELRRLTNG